MRHIVTIALILLLPALLRAQPAEAYLSNGQVWIRPPGAAAFQATHDCADKGEAAVSIDGNRIAYGVSCVAEDGTLLPLQLVILTAAGAEISRFRNVSVKKFGENCAADEDALWLDMNRVSVLCRYSDALKDDITVNAETGHVDQDFAGLWFLWSPDRRTLAHVGVEQRFGTPLGEKHCLLFNDQTIYPEGCTFEGESQASRRALKQSGKKFGARANDAFGNVHSFLGIPVWSSDSRRMAIVEKVFDWEYTDPFARDFVGTYTHMRYLLTVVSASEPAVTYPISPVRGVPHVEWANPGQVSLNGRLYAAAPNPPLH